MPIALVSLVDGERQWLKSKVGIDVCETSRDAAFCSHAILSDDLLLVPDATLDPRFADNPLVTGGMGIRFYAGMPILIGRGHAVGDDLRDRPHRPVAERGPAGGPAGDGAAGGADAGAASGGWRRRAAGGRAEVPAGGEAVIAAEASGGMAGLSSRAGGLWRARAARAARPTGRPPGRRLRRLYVCALGLVALFLVAGQVMVQRSLGAQEGRRPGDQRRRAASGCSASG